MLVIAFATLAIALHAAMLVAGNVLWGVPRDVWRGRAAVARLRLRRLRPDPRR